MKKTFETPSLAEQATLVELTLGVVCISGHTVTGAPC
jgi:hypothetical protein